MKPNHFNPKLSHFIVRATFSRTKVRLEAITFSCNYYTLFGCNIVTSKKDLNFIFENNFYKVHDATLILTIVLMSIPTLIVCVVNTMLYRSVSRSQRLSKKYQDFLSIQLINFYPENYLLLFFSSDPVKFDEQAPASSQLQPIFKWLKHSSAWVNNSEDIFSYILDLSKSKNRQFISKI